MLQPREAREGLFPSRSFFRAVSILPRSFLIRLPGPEGRISRSGAGLRGRKGEETGRNGEEPQGL